MNKCDKLYQDLFSKYRKAYPYKKGNVAQAEVNTLWKENLDHGKDD